MNVGKPFSKKKSSSSLKGSTASNPFANPQKICVNMEELLQFEAARQRALAQMGPEEYEKPFNELVPHRVFINYLDTFNGSHLAKCLSSVTRGHLGEGEGADSKTEDPTDEEDYDDFEVDFEVEERKESKFNPFYEILGTLDLVQNPNYKRPEGILELLDQEKKSEFLEKILTCGFIIYDITSDLMCHPKQIQEAKWVAESIVKRLEDMEKNRPKTFENYKDCRTFILISSLLTWAKSKPIDPEDFSLPLTEKDFRKRRPHPNYIVHCELEKRIIELGKRYPEKFRTIVVGTGIPYGHEEDILQFYFKMAWIDAPYLPIFGKGNNILPVIHIDSLSSIIHVIIEHFPTKYKYIIATDPHSITLKEIVKLIAKYFGNGKTLNVSQEEALLNQFIKQRNYDMLTSNINVQPGFIMHNSFLNWATDRKFSENIEKLIQEFKTALDLKAVKIYIHGPPASGKSYLAKRLAKYYDIPHVHKRGIIVDLVDSLKEKIKALEIKVALAKSKARKAKSMDTEEETEEGMEEEDENEEPESLESLRAKLAEMEEIMNSDSQAIDDELLIKLLKEKLESNLCMNRGYIMDGYPETMELTKLLYTPDAEEIEEEEEGEREEDIQGDVLKTCNAKIIPYFVESLDASDEFLIERVIKLPQNTLTHFEEHLLCHRLAHFRSLNTEDNTPLIYYDELDIHPMIYNIEDDKDPQMEPTYQAIIHHVGPPVTYGQTSPSEDVAEETNSLRKRITEELKAKREEVRKAAQERRDNLEKMIIMKNQELELEEKALLIMGMPLRHYLMKYIFPCLTRGLVEVARLRPDDPVDFLSEFLFRENPEGKMFQPDYDEREEKLSQAIKEYENSLYTKHSSEGKSSKKSMSTERSVKSDIVSGTSKYKCSLVTSTTSSCKTKKKSDSKGSSGKSTSKSSGKSSSVKTTSSGVCTCKKSPSLSTCSSDKTPPTPTSCTCSTPDSSEPCEPCDPNAEDKDVDPCKCPCVV